MLARRFSSPFTNSTDARADPGAPSHSSGCPSIDEIIILLLIIIATIIYIYILRGNPSLRWWEGGFK